MLACLCSLGRSCACVCVYGGGGGGDYFVRESFFPNFAESFPSQLLFFAFERRIEEDFREGFVGSRRARLTISWDRPRGTQLATQVTVKVVCEQLNTTSHRIFSDNVTVAQSTLSTLKLDHPKTGPL